MVSVSPARIGCSVVWLLVYKNTNVYLSGFSGEKHNHYFIRQTTIFNRNENKGIIPAKHVLNTFNRLSNPTNNALSKRFIAYLYVLL